METGTIVYCVLCVRDNDDTPDTTHIFSTQERALAFSASRAGACVLFDYVVDCPEHMEQRAQ